jgi:hypothetical protein
MDQVYVALLNYAEVHGNLPPVNFRDDNDHPIYSWRFGVLPFLESDLAGADFEVGWDQARNARWRNSAPHVFCYSPFALETGCTNLAVVTGIGTVFDANSQHPWNAFPPSLILLVAVGDSKAHWMHPGGDVCADDVPATVGRGVFGDGVHVQFADGIIWFLHPNVPVERLMRFFTVESARSHTRDSLLKPYLLDEYRYVGIANPAPRNKGVTAGQVGQ